MLQIKDLSVKLGTREVLKKIHFDFLPGSLYAIIGDNGAGKTTFLKAIAGILQPNFGAIYWHGEDLRNKKRQEISQIISFVPHNAPVPFDFTVEQFVHMGLYSRGLYYTDWSREIVFASLSRVDLLHFSGIPINQLSQGERQRAYIARALVSDAPVIAFDEPTANLDKKYQLGVWELMKELSENKIIITATHDLKNCGIYGSLVLALDQGNFVNDKRP